MQVAAGNVFWDSKKDLEEYHVISSFTQLLTVVISVCCTCKFIIVSNIRSTNSFFFWQSSSTDLNVEEMLL